MFSLYVLEDYIQFKEIGKLPYTTIDKFHSQFQLIATQYRDNNNFIQFNRAISTESRNPILAKN